MLKKILFYFVVSVVTVSAMLAADLSKYMGKAPRVAEEPAQNNVSVVFNTASYSKAASVTYIAVDTMANVYGLANVYINPIAYDPYSNIVAIVHRSKSTYSTGGSGGIFYAYSTDGGTTWTKRLGPMNGGIGSNTNGRYPSLVLSNATKTTNKDSVLVEVQFPLLIGGGFKGLVYSVDPGVGAAQAIATLDTTKTWAASFTSWASSSSQDVWFTGVNQDNYDIKVYHSTDGITFTGAVPAQMADAKFIGLDDVSAGIYTGGNVYIGARAKFKAAAVADTGSYTLGISKSTDKGATWSEFDIVNFHGLSGLSGYYANIYSQDFTVDGDGGYHWLATFVDSSVTPNKWSLFDIYKAAGGSWKANKIKDLPVHEKWSYGGLSQTLTENQFSVTQDGKGVVAKWIEDGRGATYKDSLPIPDVWAAGWTKANGWATPKNLTGNNGTVVNQITLLAPFCKNDGTIHFARVMAAGASLPDAAADLASSVVYYTNTAVPLTGVRDRSEPAVVGSYSLEQNYPNPFNPTTNITFTLPADQRVSLKVYNMLGQEVASLMEGQKQRGTYFVEFEASKLASGIYIYKLQAGSFTASKKMTLVK